jgi:DNA-binding NarL/FixJ family response regulator
MRSAVLTDAHPIWLDAVEELLGRVFIHTIAKTRTLGDASKSVEALRPDLVVADTALDRDPDGGLDWVRDTSQTVPETKIVVFSARSDPEYIDATLDAGADVFVLKRAQVEDFVNAVKQLFNRSVFLRDSATRPNRARLASLPDFLPLTHRELDILRLAAEGHSNAKIARVLWITEQTVKFHLSNIYGKIQVANRTEASRWAQVHGLLRTDPARAGQIA